MIWKISSEDFARLVKENNTYSKILEILGLKPKSGGGYKTLRQRIEEEGYDISHIEAGKKLFRGKAQKQKPLKEVLVIDSNCHSSALRKRLIRAGYLENKCSECGQLPWWNGKELVLQLDHINGDHNDNRIENLRILCPHCHTQTETYGRKNGVKVVLESNFCKCGARKHRQSNTCRKCVSHITKEKIIWPDSEALQKLLLEKPASLLAKELGVSDTIIGKRAKRLGLKKPGRGDWNRK